MDDFIEIVVLSGKGGAGKTTLSASLAKLLPDVVIADADVDASDMYIMLQPEIEQRTEFQGGSIASIDASVCTECGLCESLCRFDAISHNSGDYVVNSHRCEGCGLCQTVCPVQAITLTPQIVGEWYLSKTAFGSMVHARLIPGAENSGNLVTMVKHQARTVAREQDKRYILVDGPPGIGCPVTSALSGAGLVVFVAEPSLSSLHDVKRLNEIVRHFEIPAVMVINKSDMNPEVVLQLENYAHEEKISILGQIPLDQEIMALQLECKTPVEGTGGIKNLFIDLFEQIQGRAEEILCSDKK